MATRFEGGSRLARVNFFPNGEQRVHEKEREKTRRNSFNLASKSTRNHRSDRYAFHKQRKKERSRGRMQNCEKDAISEGIALRRVNDEAL